ncbi:DMT family transporter [Pseudomonas aegrilactucae]|uniref:DMT family transporter n=1 Tax=Pseudomonas aegrilactucae TaxID=2854028 RepID=A0A9Q2XKZ9_9PSED|nr:DMT family transporter [Pseudomonas aegrilactucae]MBV6288295.1 DMT family transporter [Pseudomonas aegrilactucae]
MRPDARTDTTAYLKLILVVVIWGGTFVAGRQLASEAPPLLVASVRFLLASLALLCLLPWIQRAGSRPSPRQFVQLALLGFFGVFVYNLCLFQGLHTVSASRASLIVALNPAVIALASAVLLRERLAPRRLLGIGLCLLGAAMVILVRDPQALLQSTWQGDVLILGCVVSWGVYSLFSRPLISQLGALATVTWSVLFGTLMLVLLAMVDGQLSGSALLALGPDEWSSLIYLGVLGSALAYYWYYQAIAHIGPTRAGVFIALNPVSAVVLGGLLLGEKLGPAMAMGGALVLAGIVLCNWPAKAQRQLQN